MPARLLSLSLVCCFLSACASDSHLKTTASGPYGLCKEKPIPVGVPGLTGPQAEMVFLRHLRDASGQQLEWTRNGSYGPAPDGPEIDGYSSPEAPGVEIFLDMYHPESHPFKAKPPAGFTVCN